MLSEVRKLSEITCIHPYNLPLTSNYSSFLYISTRFCSKIELIFLPDLYFKLNSMFNFFLSFFSGLTDFFSLFFGEEGGGMFITMIALSFYPPPPLQIPDDLPWFDILRNHILNKNSGQNIYRIMHI